VRTMTSPAEPAPDWRSASRTRREVARRPRRRNGRPCLERLSFGVDFRTTWPAPSTPTGRAGTTGSSSHYGPPPSRPCHLGAALRPGDLRGVKAYRTPTAPSGPLRPERTPSGSTVSAQPPRPPELRSRTSSDPFAATGLRGS
jgi:hypothetical protein